jgi:predicted SnoaL-like aldol condensation-catalyzing enzyme
MVRGSSNARARPDLVPDRAITVSARELVERAVHELFDQRDPRAVDRYWSPDYIEHSIAGANGLPGLRDLVDTLPAGFRHTRTRVISEHDLVVAHGRYDGIGATPIVAFDIWRVDQGKIVEHWDAHQPWEDQTVSGHTMIDGPTEIASPGSTAASRLTVASFAELIMMGGDRTQIGRFFCDDRFVQHNPQIADGVSGLGQAIQTGVWEAVVNRIHRIVADGEFVFTQGEGLLHGEPTAFYDLFRVENGKLAEHWDVVFPQSAGLRHANGLS